MPPLAAPEIIWFNPSREYQKDPLQCLTAIHEHAVDHGLRGVYYGVDIDDEETGVWVLAWNSLEEHQQFMGDPSYIDFIMPVMDSMVGTGEITQMFSEQREQLKKALSAPITAFVVMTVRRHHDRGYELEPVVKEYCEAFPKIPGCVGAVWGPCIERKDVEVGIIGWRSLADRDNAVRGTLAPIIQKASEISDIDFRCARLSHYSIAG